MKKTLRKAELLTQPVLCARTCQLSPNAAMDTLMFFLFWLHRFLKEKSKEQWDRQDIHLSAASCVKQLRPLQRQLAPAVQISASSAQLPAPEAERSESSSPACVTPVSSNKGAASAWFRGAPPSGLFQDSVDY